LSPESTAAADRKGGEQPFISQAGNVRIGLVKLPWELEYASSHVLCAWERAI
jgi:hypothetical protein